MQLTIDIERWRPKLHSHTFLIELQLVTGSVTGNRSVIFLNSQIPRIFWTIFICFQCMHLVFWIFAAEDPTQKQSVCWFNIPLLFLQSSITLWWRSGNCGGRHKITFDVTRIPGGWPYIGCASCGHLGLGQVKVGSSYNRLRLHRSQRIVRYNKDTHCGDGVTQDLTVTSWIAISDTETRLFN